MRPARGPAYGPDYYGAFVLDAAGNSVEAVHNGPRRQPGVIDHLWLRTRDLEAASRFYEAVCPAVDHTVERYEGRTQIRGSGATFSLVEGPPTENLHLAFEARERRDGGRLPPGRRRGRLHLERRAGGAARVPPRLLSAPSCSIPTATTSRPSSTTVAGRRAAGLRLFAVALATLADVVEEPADDEAEARSRAAARRRATPPS